MNKQHQNGSAHVVIIVVLVLALLTALGWIFWQNFIYEEPVTTKVITTNVDSDKVTPPQSIKSYSHTCFKFSYPQAGWTIKESTAVNGISMYSDNYQGADAQVTKGAVISVECNEVVLDYDQQEKQRKSVKTVSSVQRTIVKGYDGIKYVSTFEGTRMEVVSFSTSKRTYDISYTAADSEWETHRSTLNDLISTLEVK